MTILTKNEYMRYKKKIMILGNNLIMESDKEEKKRIESELNHVVYMLDHKLKEYEKFIKITKGVSK